MVVVLIPGCFRVQVTAPRPVKGSQPFGKGLVVLQGIVYQAADKAKSDLYLAFEGFLNTQRVEFHKDEQLITELVNLERKRGRSGRDLQGSGLDWYFCPD